MIATSIDLYRTRFFNDPNLVAYWRLNDLTDEIGTNNLVQHGVTFPEGKFQYCADFGINNTTKYLSKSSPTGLPTGSSARSVCFWFYAYSMPPSFVDLLVNYGGGAVRGMWGVGFTSTTLYQASYDDDVEVPCVIPLNTWNHMVTTFNGSSTVNFYFNGAFLGQKNFSGTINTSSDFLYIPDAYWWLSGKIDDVAIFSRVLSFSEVSDLYKGSKSRFVNGIDAGSGILTKNDNNSLGTDLVAWKQFQPLIRKNVNSGTIFSKDIVSTYALIYTNATAAYQGGILASNGDIHFIPRTAPVGQKVSLAGVVSTYSLVYTNGTAAYSGAVLASNGDIHFIPSCAVVGQKISSSGIVSTYSLVYTYEYTYYGGVLSPNGDIHFVPNNAAVGQKVSASGIVSTYSLVRTPLGGETGGYVGGVLAPNGDIHFIPSSSPVGQKISISGVVSTYSLVSTSGNERFIGGVLAFNGDIHFVPACGSVGQKVSSTGIVSTYSLVYTTSDYAYLGGVLAPNGDIHFVPCGAPIGQKVSASGVVSTYSLVHTVGYNYFGGVAAPNGDIHFMPHSNTVGQKISTFPAIPFSQTVCQSPFFNKF